MAAPAIITGRAPIRSRSDPSSGLLSPAASGAAELNAENHARLHPKCFTTGRKNTPPAFTGPQIRNSVANRVPTISQRPLLSSVILHLAAHDLSIVRVELGPTIFLTQRASWNWINPHIDCAFFHRAVAPGSTPVKPWVEFGAAPAAGRDAESSRSARTQQRPRRRPHAPARSAAGLHA